LNIHEKENSRWTPCTQHLYIYMVLPNNNNQIWKMKIPLKILKLMWYLLKCVIVAKDNLPKCIWHESMKCRFCHHEETKHLLCQCKCVFPFVIWPFTNCFFFTTCMIHHNIKVVCRSLIPCFTKVCTRFGCNRWSGIYLPNYPHE
jgi:hypothetical protein